MKKQTPEQIVKTAICQWLELKHVFFWLNSSVGIYDPIRKIYRKNNSRYHRNGQPDILGITMLGTFFGCEVKAPGKKPTPEQQDFITEANARGAICFWADSLDSFISQWEERII